jgi:putative FmdB family regulatory protein
MPIYSYTCKQCGQAVEQIVTYARRDNLAHCECGGELQRSGVEAFALGKPTFEMGAIMRDGSRVKGHFGKEAPKKRRGTVWSK